MKTMCDLMDCVDCRKYQPTQDVKCAAVQAIWDEFGDVPMDPQTECIEEDWRGFEAGTHREEIWHWFEERFNVSVAALMYG